MKKQKNWHFFYESKSLWVQVQVQVHPTWHKRLRIREYRTHHILSWWFAHIYHRWRLDHIIYWIWNWWLPPILVVRQSCEEEINCINKSWPTKNLSLNICRAFLRWQLTIDHDHGKWRALILYRVCISALHSLKNSTGDIRDRILIYFFSNIRLRLRLFLHVVQENDA